MSMPILLAPVGYSRLMHPGGEAAAAAAAGATGTGYILSTISGFALEEVKAATSGPVWYQLYLLGGRESAQATIERDGGQHGKMTLAATEFLRRFFLHVLPRGFVRIPHFGFLANRFRAPRLALGRQLLASSGSTE